MADAVNGEPPHHVVCIEGGHFPIPKLAIPHKYTEYAKTKDEEVLERIRDATIVITAIVPITSEIAAQCPRLQLILVLATGCGWVDAEYFRTHGIDVINCRHSNIAAVAEHALGFYFATRRRTVFMHNLTVSEDEWAQKGTLNHRFDMGPPLGCSQETAGIIGYGALGQQVERLFTAVGMGSVLVAERRGADRVRNGRAALDEVLRTASVIVICCPKDESTINLIDEPELRNMRKEAVVLNMARGGIVNEHALVKALRERWIFGAATDVFDVEPGQRGKCPLLPADNEGQVPNLTVSPHMSWFATNTIANLQRMAKDGIESWVAGSIINVVVRAQR